MPHKHLLIACALLATTACAPIKTWHQEIPTHACCLDIAHAAGALDGVPYTNSVTALDQNLSRGRKVFEVDFQFTSDNHLVLNHDWDDFDGQPLSHAAFMTQELAYTPTDLPLFLNWLKTHCPECRVITDAKDDFWTFWAAFTQQVPQDWRRAKFIIQTYSVAQSMKLAALDPQQPQILTLYLQDDITDAQLETLKSNPNLIAVTMPINRLPTWRARVEKALSLPVYTHGYPWMMTSNFMLRLAQSSGAKGFYKD